MAATIVTGQLIKQYLQLEDSSGEQDVLLDRLGLATEALLEKWLGRSLTAVEHVGNYDGNGKDALYLRHGPITTLTSVSINGSSLTVGRGDWPLAQVVYLPNSDCIRRTDGGVFTAGISNILVEHTAGLSPTPATVIQAGVQWAAQMFSSGRRHLSADNGIDLAAMPETVKFALWPYRRVAF